MTTYTTDDLDSLVTRIKLESGVDIKFKDVDESVVNRLLSVIPTWRRMNTTLFSTIWLARRDMYNEHPDDTYRTLQHEWVHVRDSDTLMGLSPSWLKYVNRILWYSLYLMPQLLSPVFLVVAIMSLIHGITWLAGTAVVLTLVTAAPIPAPFRAWAELRAYRRDREFGRDIDELVRKFTSPTYYYMWPFKKYVRRSLMLDSPYKESMDER